MGFDLSPRPRTLDRRAAFDRYVATYFPSDYGDEAFTEILHGRWSPGGGTTCTYPWHHFWALLGCRDDRLVNFDSADGYTRWVSAGGVSKIVQGAKAIGAWVDDAPGREPQRGDVCFLADSARTPASEHVSGAIDPGLRTPGIWTSADAGQNYDNPPTPGDDGHQRARIVTRRIDDRRASGGPRLLSSPEPYSGDWRELVGWVDLNRIPLAATPAEVLLAPARPLGMARPLFVLGALATAGAIGLASALAPPARRP